MTNEIKPFSVVKYVNKDGVECAAKKTTLPNGMAVVYVQRADLPKGKAEMMSLDTFMKEELPNVTNPNNIRHAGDTFEKS